MASAATETPLMKLKKIPFKISSVWNTTDGYGVSDTDYTNEQAYSNYELNSLLTLVNRFC